MSLYRPRNASVSGPSCIPGGSALRWRSSGPTSLASPPCRGVEAASILGVVRAPCIMATPRVPMRQHLYQRCGGAHPCPCSVMQPGGKFLLKRPMHSAAPNDTAHGADVEQRRRLAAPSNQPSPPSEGQASLSQTGRVLRTPGHPRGTNGAGLCNARDS
jgi:hypothetical protein